LASASRKCNRTKKKELASYDLENKKSHERDITYGEGMIEGKRIDSMDEAVHEL